MCLTVIDDILTHIQLLFQITNLGLIIHHSLKRCLIKVTLHFLRNHYLVILVVYLVFEFRD
jgi:hypothetical protein